MISSKFRSSVRKALALVAASLIVAGASFINNSAMAQTTVTSTSTSVVDAAKHRPPRAPEANTGIVLMPFLLAVLLLSSRHLLRRQVAQKR
jgi:hypothetical protein